MLALRWHGRGDIRIENLPEFPEPGPSELLLDVEAAGICGTDLHEWLSGPHVVATAPDPLTGLSAPVVLGHEFVGRVRATGSDTVTEIGTLVAVEVNRSCGHCPACITGTTNLCRQLASYGLHADGGLAEQVLVSASLCIPVGDLSATDAVLAEPLAVAVRGLRLLDLERPSLLCVFGGGAVGQLLARLAVQSGHRVAVIDPNQARCDLALAHGAIGACRPEEAAGLCRELTGGEGFDACADTAGAPGVVAAAVDVVKRGGCVALIGADHSPMSLSPLTLIMSEVRLQAVLSHTLDDFVAAVELLVGRKVSVEGLVTGVVPLSQAVERAFETLRDRPEYHLKMVVVPDSVLAQSGKSNVTGT